VTTTNMTIGLLATRSSNEWNKMEPFCNVNENIRLILNVENLIASNLQKTLL